MMDRAISPRTIRLGVWPAVILLSLLCAVSTQAQISTNVTIYVSDGVGLEATIVRPLGFPPSGGFPGLVLVHGFGGNKGHMYWLSVALATYGYASIAYSVRGQGNSGGLSTISGPREVHDLLEVIQYFRSSYAINPNNLGITGASQGGIHSWVAATHQMPGIRAVAPLMATPDFARALIPNNCVSYGLVREMLIGTVRYSADRDRVRDFIIADDWDSILVYINARDQEQYLGNVQVPVMQALGWADYLFPVNGGIRGRANLSARGISSWSYYGTNGHGEPPDTVEVAFVSEKLVDWFDHWLRGFSMPEDSTVVYADDRPGWPHHTTPVWPPQPYQDLRLYLSDETLSETPPSTTFAYPFSQAYDTTYAPAQAWTDRYGGAAFVNALATTTTRLMSQPLAGDIQVTGIPTGRFFVQSNAPKFQVHVRYFDVSWTGTGYEWRLISRSLNGIRNNIPGSTHEVQLEARALSHIVPAGHRIGIEITSLDMLSSTQSNVVPFFVSSQSTVLTSSGAPSYVSIPVVGNLPVAIAYTPSEIPAAIMLHQNHPNPFNPSTTIRFELPERSHVSLRVYNLLGEEMATLVDGEVDAGVTAVEWRADNIASGVYFFRLQASGRSLTRKMVLAR